MCEIPIPIRMLVCDDYQCTHSLRKTGENLQMSHETARQIKTTGSVYNHHRSGRNRVTTETDDRRIKFMATHDNKVTAKRIKENIVSPVSESTIKRRLKENTLYSGIATRKPLISKANQKKRMAFALVHASRPISWWHLVLWSC